jgi:hypothetical protein
MNCTTQRKHGEGHVITLPQPHAPRWPAARIHGAAPRCHASSFLALLQRGDLRAQILDLHDYLGRRINPLLRGLQLQHVHAPLSWAAQQLASSWPGAGGQTVPVEPEISIGWPGEERC